jgi:hypothetical protein
MVVAAVVVGLQRLLQQTEVQAVLAAAVLWELTLTTQPLEALPIKEHLAVQLVMDLLVVMVIEALALHLKAAVVVVQVRSEQMQQSATFYLEQTAAMEKTLGLLGQVQLQQALADITQAGVVVQLSHR